jgi:hypothetical protein
MKNMRGSLQSGLKEGTITLTAALTQMEVCFTNPYCCQANWISKRLENTSTTDPSSTRDENNTIPYTVIFEAPISEKETKQKQKLAL